MGISNWRALEEERLVRLLELSVGIRDWRGAEGARGLVAVVQTKRGSDRIKERCIFLEVCFES